MNRPIFMVLLADVAIVLALALLGLVGYRVMAHLAWPPINAVNVTGINDFVDTTKLEAIIQQAQMSGYVALGSAALAREIATISFVRQARITRTMPFSLDIALESQPLVGYWHHDEPNGTSAKLGNVLINRYGEIFISETPVAINLPVVWAANTGDEAQDRFTREALVARLHTWQSWTDAKKWRLTKLSVSQALMWEAEWNGRIRVNLGSWKSLPEAQEAIGKTAINAEDLRVLDERMKRFLASLPTLSRAYGSNTLAVDMRYPQGMAVRVFTQRN